MKYFFLSEGWTVGRVWSTEGLWNELAWRRSPHIERTSLSIVERGESLWLYRAEDAVVMLEVRPVQILPDHPTGNPPRTTQPIGQVVLRRLLHADGVLERLSSSQAVCQIRSIDFLN